MTSLTPRPYQVEAIEAYEQAHERGVKTPALVLATGLGKTVIFSHGAARHHERTGRRVLVLAHRTELVEQAADKLRSVMPDLPIGIVQAERNQTLAPIVVASPQTLRNLSRRRQLLNVGLVIADECHHYAAPSYREVLDYYLEQGADALGVTATMSRGDRRSLGEVWAEVVFTRDIRFGQQHGYLVQAAGKRVRVDDLDLRAVKRRGGDYEPDALGDALTASMAPKRIAEALTEHAPAGRTVVFAPTIASAAVIGEEIATAGFSVGTVNYLTPKPERRRTLAAHASGDLQVVTNAMVLTEGWDNPACDTAVIARQTQNSGLYQQMVGRILRPFFGKRGALVLDVVGAAERHTLQAQIDLFGEEYEEPDPCGPHSPNYFCTCRKNGCGEACACGGGKACGCPWAERTLLEAGEDDEQTYADGRLLVEDIDLFHNSVNSWLTTAGGTHFIPAGDRFVAILPAPAPGHWDVIAMHRYIAHDPAYSRYVQRNVSDLGFAQAWAEGDVTPDERAIARKDRSWRAKRPTEGQRRYATRYRIPVGPGMHAGELSNMIAVAEASYRIDSTAAALAARQRAS